MALERKNFIQTTTSAEQTMSLGFKLAGILNSGDLIVLTGPLGAGKTCLVKGIAKGLGIPEDEVNSPSYTLVNEYHGKIMLYHFDLYRLENESELYNIGWDDYLMREGIIAVEWGERAGGFLPDKHISVNIKITAETGRELKVTFS
jgi:tRNA threonylcarbamoyladenosine biosynthesis protein TsaE